MNPGPRPEGDSPGARLRLRASHDAGGPIGNLGAGGTYPHTFRKTVATLIDRLVDSDTAARLLGHSSDAITKEFYIEKDRTTPDVTQILQSFAGGTRTIASDD